MRIINHLISSSICRNMLYSIARCLGWWPFAHSSKLEVRITPSLSCFSHICTAYIKREILKSDSSLNGPSRTLPLSPWVPLWSCNFLIWFSVGFISFIYHISFPLMTSLMSIITQRILNVHARRRLELLPGLNTRILTRTKMHDLSPAWTNHPRSNMQDHLVLS